MLLCHKNQSGSTIVLLYSVFQLSSLFSCINVLIFFLGCCNMSSSIHINQPSSQNVPFISSFILNVHPSSSWPSNLMAKVIYNCASFLCHAYMSHHWYYIYIYNVYKYCQFASSAYPLVESRHRNDCFCSPAPLSDSIFHTHLLLICFSNQLR